MKVVIADCSATYTGRGDTTLSRGVRAIIIKDDGSVSIHNEVGNKPLNYMKTATFVESLNNFGEKVWTYDSRKESLAITIHALCMMTEMPLITDDPGLVRDGTENHLQEWISTHPHVLGEGFRLVRREYPTGKGPVDLLVLDADGLPVAVEVKRVAMLGAVDQCRRYLDALKDPESHLSKEEKIAIETIAKEAARRNAEGVTEDGGENRNKTSHELDTADQSISIEAKLLTLPKLSTKVFETLEETSEKVEIDFSKVRGMIAGVDLRPKTLEWAAKHSIQPVWIPVDWREIE